MELALLDKIAHAEHLVKDYTKKYPNCSFAFSGGKDSAVLVWLAQRALGGHARANMRIDAVLADTEFDQTYDYIEEYQRLYGVKINRHFYLNDPKDIEHASKENKTEKFKQVLADVDCWFSGIRRDEGATRTEIEEMEDRGDGLIKVNPLAQFKEMDIWRTAAIFRIPLNKAYQGGYRSLSCKLTSVPEKSGDESERAGRWNGTEHEGGECGIHSCSLREGVEPSPKKKASPDVSN